MSTGSASCGRSVSMTAIWSVSRPMLRSASPIWLAFRGPGGVMGALRHAGGGCWRR